MGSSSPSQQQSQSTESYTKTPTYQGQIANETLNSLGGLFGQAGGAGQNALNYYSQQLAGGSQNPYVESVIGTTDVLGAKDFSNKLAQVRSSGYGGGTGRDTVNQGQFASDYQSQRDQANAQLRLQAWQAQQEQQNQAAGGIQNTLGQALNFLGMLRGESGTSTGTTIQDLIRSISGGGGGGYSGGGSSGSGGSSGGQLCWIARELFGENDPRWQQFREWLLNESPDEIRDAYEQNGEEAAKELKNCPKIKAVFKTIFEAIVERSLISND